MSQPQGHLRGLHIIPGGARKAGAGDCAGRFSTSPSYPARSPTFGRHADAVLSAENWQQLWVPAGFAHGYCTLEDDTEVQYKVTDYYSPPHERGIDWNDPALMIPWPVPAITATVSERDRNGRASPGNRICSSTANDGRGDRGRRVYRLGVGSRACRRWRARGHRRQADLCRQSRHCARSRLSRSRLRPRRYLRSRGDGCGFQRAPSPRRVSSRRGEPCRSHDRYARHLRGNQHRRHGDAAEAALGYWRALDRGPGRFRFLQVSTDEVYGELGPTGQFNEKSRYRPSSPYSASKAGADHLARAWHRTYGLPVLVSNCSNNYGPYQFPEKLIPLMVLNGSGRQAAAGLWPGA